MTYVHAYTGALLHHLKTQYRAGLRFLAALALTSLSACAIVPGDQTYDMREQSATKLPVKQADDTVPGNVQVKPITAELIIDQEKAKAAARERGTASPAAPVGFTAPADYIIGPGDILNITVWDHPELTIPAGSYRTPEQSGNLVTEDGSIFYPYVGRVKVAGLNVGEVRELLTRKLSRTIEKVQLDVRVISFRSKKVYVVGEVKTPGLQEITDIPLNIIDAVNRAGGFTPDADHSHVLLTRDGKTWRVDLQALYEEGATEQNVLLKAGDIVNISDRAFNKVFVLGDIQKPGSYFMSKRRISLAEALAEAGYINQATANPHWIFVMRGQGASPELYHLNAKSPDALLLADRFSLRPRDIVYVDTSELARLTRVVSLIQPTLNLLNTGGAPFPLLTGN